MDENISEQYCKACKIYHDRDVVLSSCKYRNALCDIHMGIAHAIIRNECYRLYFNYICLNYGGMTINDHETEHEQQSTRDALDTMISAITQGDTVYMNHIKIFMERVESYTRLKWNAKTIPRPMVNDTHMYRWIFDKIFNDIFVKKIQRFKDNVQRKIDLEWMQIYDKLHNPPITQDDSEQYYVDQ